MAEKSSRNKVSIGASSLILIFIVLCMATFGLLSLSSAQGDLKLARRNADAVKVYYEADNKGQQWLKDVEGVLMDRGRSLRIELVLMCGEKRYEVKSWYVYNSEEYEIDTSMPVWGGETPTEG